MMTLRHLLSVVLTATCLDVEIRCVGEPSPPEPRTPRVTALASSVEALHTIACPEASRDDTVPLDVDWTTEIIRLWQLRAQLSRVQELSSGALVCVGSNGLLWQDLGPLRSALTSTEARIGEQERALNGASTDKDLPQNRDGFEVNVCGEVEQVLHQSTLLVDEAGAHGCPL